MDAEGYQSDISQIRFGKRVGTSIYFYESCSQDLPTGVSEITNEVLRAANRSGFRFNVYKIDTRTPLVSLLDYPGFFDEPFPTLLRSATWDATAKSLNVRDYPNPDSRPVLHRKELLLPNDHEKIDEFAALTEISEQVGLFADPSRIGRFSFWNALLDEKNLQIVGHSLYRTNGERIELREPEIAVPRYKTALKRNRLSLPIQLMYKHSILAEEATLFDYGCGRGDDVRQLRDLGVSAWGWDPHFAPRAKKKRADIVNLGYVVNVIESIEERRQVISDAFSYADRVIVISALSGSKSYSSSARPYKDGMLTSTGSFQRYYQPNELAQLIHSSINVDPISVAPGVMFAFKDKQAEQEFVAQRVGRRSASRIRPLVSSVDDLTDDAQRQARRYWRACIELGRPAERGEVVDCDELFKQVPSAQRLFRIVSANQDKRDFETARQSRKEDLLVRFALSHFGKRIFFKSLPEELKKDIQFHFGNYTSLIASSKQLLHSIADTGILLNACIDATDNGIGFLLDDHSLQLHLGLLDRLAPVLRVYVGCAGLLYGDWGQIDLVKVHIQSGKVSFMGYDDFEGRPVPDLIERIKVKLWQRDVEFYDYIGQFAPTPLLMKSLYIDSSFDYFEDQAKFDKALMRTQLFDFGKERVTKAQFSELLELNGYRIQGYDLVRLA